MWNSGNCRSQASRIAWILSFGCLDMGTILSRFSSTNNRTNILNALSLSGSKSCPAGILSSSSLSSSSSSSLQTDSSLLPPSLSFVELSQLSSLALLFLSGCPRSSERVDGDFDIGNVRLVSSSAIGLSSLGVDLLLVVVSSDNAGLPSRLSAVLSTLDILSSSVTPVSIAMPFCFM